MELEELKAKTHLFTDTLNEISKYIFTSKYARYNAELGRRETWEEAVWRTEDMHLRKFSHIDKKYLDEIKWAFDMVRDKRTLPSMRGLQFSGPAIEAHNIRTFNCSVMHVDSLRSFSEAFYLLLCGSGVGFGLSKRFLNRLPDLVTAEDRTGIVMTYVVEDSIEGWADSVEALLNCYFKSTPYSGRKIVFDYSRIRPAGAELKTSGGKAPGYEGLKAAHIKIKDLLDSIIEVRGQDKLYTIDAYDILMHVADAVLSGGVRRSACSVIFDKDDYRMINAKTGNWFEENPQRARSNNSVLLVRDEVTYEEFESIALRTKEWGEPGFAFASHKDVLMNPCFTLDQRILTEDGWRPFSDLLGTTPTIHQDTRIIGSLVDGKEVWTLTGADPGSTILTPVTKVAQTGTDQLVYKLVMSSGRETKATGNHHFATQDGMVELSKLNVGDKVMVAVPEAYESDTETLDFQKGWLAGLTAGNGNMDDENVNLDLWNPCEYDKSSIEAMAETVIRNYPEELGGRNIALKPKFNETSMYGRYRLGSAALKKIFTSVGFETKKDSDYSWLHNTNKEFKSGFISGLFYADGHFEGDLSSKTVAGRITQSNKPMLQNIQLVCQELGLLTRIYDLLEENAGPTYKMSFSGKDMLTRFKAFAHVGRKKIEKLDQFVDKVYGNWDVDERDDYTDTVLSISISGIEDVYCLEENVNRTLIVEGLTARRCFEIGFLPVTEDGRTGVQMCNLTTVNGGKVASSEDLYDAVKAASIIGTLQASYTDFKYLSNTAKELTENEALLGVSITGMLENPQILLDPIVLQTASAIAVETNIKMAKAIGIKPASRVTCIKPEGTSSLALGSMYSGIHPAHSRVMWRRVQANKLDNVYRHFKDHNPHLCEESVWSANKTDDVITFPVMLPDNGIVKSDLSAIEHLEMIKTVQKNWVLPGTSPSNESPATHNVSCTTLVAEDEWDDVFHYIYDNKEYFTAISLLSKVGDKQYKQAPNESVVTEEELGIFYDQMYNFMGVDYSWLNEDEDNTKLAETAACIGPEGCEVK